jgi:mannose-6-phosphate isomerase-like protein (cupin superfamily)
MNKQSIVSIKAGADIDNEYRSLGVSTVQFKIGGPTSSDLFILENRFTAVGGPAKHLHLNQEEWFYCLEGQFAFEIGGERMLLLPGESLLGPRRIPHVWAHVGASTGRILVVFAPAGRMEAFFREVTKADAMPPQDPDLWRRYDMELLGPPMEV